MRMIYTSSVRILREQDVATLLIKKESQKAKHWLG